MVFYGVVPECHRSVSGMVSECIMSAKMVSLSASGTVRKISLVFIRKVCCLHHLKNRCILQRLV